MRTIEDLERTNTFLSSATLTKVTHDGTCFLRCLQALLEVPMPQLVDEFISLGKGPYVKEDVRAWCEQFARNYPAYTADTRKTRMLPGESFVTSYVLEEFARARRISLLMVAVHNERRHAVKVSELYEPEDIHDGALVCVLIVDGQKFDYLTPHPDKREQYWDFVDEAIAVCWFYYISVLILLHSPFAFHL